MKRGLKLYIKICPKFNYAYIVKEAQAWTGGKGAPLRARGM